MILQAAVPCLFLFRNYNLHAGTVVEEMPFMDIIDRI